MRLSRPATVWLAAAVFASVPGLGLGAVDEPEAEGDDGLEPGDRVHILSADFESDRMGVVCAVGAKGLELRRTKEPCAEAVTLPWESIGRLEVAQGKRTRAREGALMGGLAVGGAALGLIGDVSGDGAAVAGTFVALLAGVGSGLGALVGHSFETDDWQRFDLPRPPSRLRVGLAPVRGGAGLALTWEFPGRRGQP